MYIIQLYTAQCSESHPLIANLKGSMRSSDVRRIYLGYLIARPSIAGKRKQSINLQFPEKVINCFEIDQTRSNLHDANIGWERDGNDLGSSLAHYIQGCELKVGGT